MISWSAVVCLAFLAAVSATQVDQCPGRSLENLSNSVELNPCKKLPCKLKKGTNQQISIKFTPEKELKDLKNAVSAVVFGVPLPFIGVDGMSICDKVYTESGDKASCPLTAGTTYIYKDSFPILNIYPTLQLKVLWELKEKENKSIVCFEVPARIQ